MNDIDLDGMTDEQLMQIAGISQNEQNEQTEQQQTASQTQSFDQNAGYTPEQMDSMTDEQLLRIAGIAQPQNGHASTVQTAQGFPAEQEDPNAPKPLSDAEWAEVHKGVVNEGDTPLSKGVESFMDSWFGQGRKDAMDNYRRQTRDGGVGGSVLGYLSDLGNSFWAGLVGGGAKIAEAAGHLTRSDGLVQGAKSFEAGVNEYMPTDMTDTAQRFDENGVPVERTWGQRIADEGKNVVRMAGEFAPASIPGVGGAYTYANIVSGGVNRYNELVNEAMDNGLSKAQARIIGGAGFAIDVFSNAFLMGKFRGKGVPPIEERYFKSFIGKMLSGAAKTAGVMGVSGGFQDALQQMAENGDFDIERTGNAVLDGAIQGAMFHVMNEGLHAPVKWSAAKAKRAADARRAEMADVDSMRADAAKEAEAERDARISSDLAAQSAMKVLEEPLGVAKFIQQNQDVSLDIINARRLGRDVDMDALLADGPEGIPDVLKPAFRTQQDANAFGDRLLEYYYNGRKAEERAQRESGIRQAFDDFDRRNAEEYIADQDMRERWKENLETARAEEDAARARTRRGEDIRAAFADHDLAVAERRQELAKKRADRIAGKIEDDVRAADESRVAQDAMELADRDAELKAMREANKGREKSVAEEAREDARIQREEKANADAQDRATAEDAARYDAEVEDAATRFRNGEGIPSYEQWLGNRADTKAMRWKYDAMVNEAARKKIGMPEAKAEEAPQKTKKVAEQAPVADSSPVAEAAPQTAENGARKPVSEMTKQDINARFKELVDEANKALEGDSTERAHAAAKALDDFKKEVTDDGRFNIFQSMEQDGVIPKSVDVFEKSTDADYKAYLKKNGYRDSRKHRTIFEQVWRKEHRETVEKGTVDAPVAEAVNQPTETREAPTEAQGEDSAYRAWLAKQTGRDGKPKADSGAMRMQYETLVKGIEEAKNILSSLKRISSYENILPRVSSEKLIETLNDSRAKDPKYADMISRVRAELERRGKMPSEPPKTANEPHKAKRTAPNQGYSYEDYAGETGDDVGHAILRDGPKLNIPEGLMEYRRAVANWNKLKDKSSRPKPKMSDFGVTDPSADFINNLLDGASRADRIRLFGFKPSKGSNDGFSERLHDPALRAEFDRYAEQHGASAALERFASDMLGAHERYGRWSSEKRTAEADRKAENEILNERMEDLLKAEKDENAEWDAALGEIESGDEGFGANGEYIIPFSRARLSQAKRGDIIRFGKDKAEFTLLGFDKDSGVMEVVGEDGGNPRFFEVSENGVKEVRNGRNEKESVQNHDRDENGERRGQGEGGEGGAGEFQLESATPEQLEAERVRLRQREEIARRQAQPIKGGGEYGQTLMDLGGAEGEDLFNRTAPAQGYAPAKPETDIKALGAAAKKAMQDLRSMGAVDDRTLASYSRQWRKQKGDRFQRMADAADTVLKYREAVKNQPPRDGGAFRGSAEDAGETRYSRTVSDAERSDPSVVSRIADRLSRLVPGVKVKVAELSPDERAAGAVASYDRRTGTATFSPDSNLSDVVHEIGGHAIRQWAERNCPELLRKAVEYARNAPMEIKDYVYRNYADRRADGSYVYDGNALLDEIFAHRFAKEHGEEFRRMLEEKPKARKWWANISNAVRSVFQNAAKRNGVDTESLKGLDAEAYMKGVAEQLVAGKELNEWTAYGRDAKLLGPRTAPVGGADYESRNSRRGDGAEYDERMDDGRRYNEKYAGVGNSGTGFGRAAADRLGAVGRDLDAALSARRENAGEAESPLLRYSRTRVGSREDMERDIKAHEKMRFWSGKTRESGMESLAVVRDGDSVYKYRDEKAGIENAYFNAARHNEMFGDMTPYEIVDYAEGGDGNIVVLKQPYIDLIPKSGRIARKQLEANLRRRFGDVEVSRNGLEMRAGGWVIDDLKDENIGIDRKTGRYAVVDAIVRRNEDYPGGKPPKIDAEYDLGEKGEGTVLRDGSAEYDEMSRRGDAAWEEFRKSRDSRSGDGVRATRIGNTITFARRENGKDNGMHDSGLREEGRDVGGGSPDRLSFVERTSYRPNRIHDLFRSLNSDADSSALAERVFAAADSLGARFGFGDIRKVSKNEDAVGAERMGRALYDSEYFARGDVNDQVKADKILQEAIHSVTSYALSITDGGHALSDVGRVNARLREATSDLRDVYLQSLDRLGDAYGAKNEYEFVAELSNPSFRSKLKKIGVWDRTVNAVKRIIDSVLVTNLSKTNANDAAMRALDRILENGDREAFYTARKFAADRDPVAEREFGDPVDSDGETMYSRRSYDDRELRDLISFKPGDMKISRKEIDNGYRQASVRSGVLARRIEALLGNDEGGRARVGSGDAGGARQARELAGVQGEGRTNEGALERVLRGVSAPLGKWRTDPEIGLRDSTSPFPDGEMSKIGGESEVFYDKKHGDVLKLRNLDSFEGVRLPHIPQYANDFNFFFGKFSPITIDSFGVTKYGDGVKGMPNEIIRQKYAEFKKDGWEEALEKIHEDLSRRFPGMKWLGNEIAQIGNKRISDLHSDNLGIDVRTGKPFVRDCNIDSAGDYSYETERSPTMYSRRADDFAFSRENTKLTDRETRNGYELASSLAGRKFKEAEVAVRNVERGASYGLRGDEGEARGEGAPSKVRIDGVVRELERRGAVIADGVDPFAWASSKFDGRFEDGSRSKRGSEAVVYKDGNDVVKMRLANGGARMLKGEMQYIKDFNFMFGKDSHYTLDGFVRSKDGRLFELIRQRNSELVKGSDFYAFEKIVNGLSERFGNVEESNGAIIVGNKEISDLSGDNVGIDARTGRPFVRDCDIHTLDENGNVRYSRRAPRSANGQKSVDEKESFGTKLRRAVQDNLVGWRNFQDETGGVRDVVDGNTGHTDFRKSTDFYEAKDRQNGYEEKDMRALQRTRDRIDETLVDAGVSNDDFGKFLALRHAEERNRAIARKKGVAFTMGYADGAGISSSRANSMLDAMLADPAKAAALDSAGNAYDAMMRADLDRRLSSGRISQEDYNNLSQYKHYAPLRRDQSSDALGMFNSSTGGMKKNEFVGAKGLGADRLFDQNGNLTVNPYEFGLIQAQEGIRGSLENESRLVLRNLVNLANSRGNTLGEIVEGQAMPRGAGYTFEFGNGDRVVADSGYNIAGNRRDIVLFKDGGKLKAIRIDAGENGNGLRLADAANGRDMAKWNKALEWIPKMTRAMAAMRTQYVPTFIARNFKADTLDAMTAALGRFGVKDAASIAKDMVKAEVSNAKDLKAYIKDGTLNGYVREAVEGGLLTKGGTASQGFDDMVSKIKNHRAKLEREKKEWYRRGTIDNAKQILSTLGESISMMNEFAENSTRIGMFTALRKLRTKQYPNGVPVNEAVKFCRDATTNFNRHGWLTPYINGAFMFSNAATQGMTRNIQAVRDVHGRQLVGTLIALGTAEALVNHYFGNDDERENEGKGNARNLSEYEKKHQIGIPIGGGRQAIWQTRGLYATIPYLARTAVDAMLGETKVPDALMNVLSEAGSVATEPLSGNGLSSKATAMQSLSPTLVDPLVQWVSGNDYKGDDRIAKSYNANKPLSWNGKGKTSEGYKWFAKLVNSATGGNEGRKGLVDMAPEDVQLIVETIVGGIGRDVSQIGSGIQTARQLADGESPERVLGETAFMRDWVREYPNVGSRYYAAVNRLDAMKTELASKKTYEEKSAYVRDNPIAATKRTKVLEKMEKTIRDYQALGRGMSKDKSGKYVENPHVSAESKKRYNDLAAKMMARFVNEVEKND